MSYQVLRGARYYTGLLIPEARPLTYVSLADSVDLWADEQIRDVISDNARLGPNARLDPRKEFADWLKNQGRRGSCNGYAGVAALERAIYKRTGKRVILSGEFLYAAINGGRDQGSMLDDGMARLVEGVCEQSLVPYEEYLWSRISEKAKQSATFKAFEPYRVDTEQELAHGLAAGYPGVVAVHVGGGYNQLDSEGVRGASNGPGNHAVCVDDVIYKGGEYRFNEAGSWGLNNGQKGYAYLTWKRHLQSTVKYHAFYLIRSTNDQ